MSNFNVQHQTQTVPFGMKVVGSGVIISCLVLCVLFGWGIHLDLERKEACEGVLLIDEEISMDLVLPFDQVELT